MTQTFNMGDMKSSLPDSDPSNGPKQPNGWVKPEAYDYDSLQPQDPAVTSGNWDGSAKVYEWDGDQGDVGPEYPELEVELFGKPEDRKEVTGIDFMKIAQIDVVQEGLVKINPVTSFKDAGLHPIMLRNIELAGYEAPTPIQKFTIPSIHLGYDVIGIAQTGSGKTAAYMIPILNKLMGKAKKLAAPRPNPATYRPGIDPPVRAEPLVAIVVPTRELAIQIFNEARKFCYRTMLRPCVAYGGGPISEQIQILGKGCDVLIATPGRLVDFIQRPHVLTFRRLKYMVIDEADEMLQADWESEFKQILAGGEQDEGNIKYMLFSATFPKAARDLAKEYLASSHVRFRVGRAGSSHENIKQQIFEVEPQEKKKMLVDQLTAMPPCRTIIFVNSKPVADDLDDFLFNMGLPCTSMHSDRTQLEREAAMRAFRAGKAPILIATGVSARGIDVKNVMHVINYDLPSMDYGGIEEYTHRIGRTGRIGHRGIATSFFTNRDEPMASVLTRTLLETKQEVPEFLQMHLPDGDARVNLKFEADSDFGDDDGTNGMEDGNGGAWSANPSGPVNGNDFGNQPPVANANGPTGGQWGGPDAPPAPVVTQVMLQPGFGAAPSAPKTAPIAVAAAPPAAPYHFVAGANAPNGQPAAASAGGGWGAPPAVPAAAAAAANAWGAPAPPTPAVATTSNGWGAPAASAAPASFGW